MLLVQVTEFLDNGDGVYRYHAPCRELSRMPGVVGVDCDLQHRCLPELMRCANVVIFHAFDWDLFTAIEDRRAAGRATVLEANDYYPDVQPWNPRAAQWADAGVRELLDQCMQAVDAVQTSTPELAQRWKPFARRVAVFPNHLTDVPSLRAAAERPLTIGWGGSTGHLADWYDVAPVLERWLSAHPNVRLAVMANEQARSFIHLSPERYEFRPFGPLAEYFNFLGSLDIGLAPLLPTDFNRGRSDVKYLEYAAHGVAGVYRDLEPYQGVKHGETGLLYRTNAELLARLDQLVSDPQLRAHIRQTAHQEVAVKRRLADHVGERLACYRALLKQTSAAAVLPDDVLAMAQRDGDYYQLRPQEPEQTVHRALRESARRDVAQSLVGVVDRWPRYLAALQQLGRMLNDLREPRAAQDYLERALILDGRSARTRCELARSRFLQGDTAAARRGMAEALSANPYYQLGWQYLLRLGQRAPDAESARWADQVAAVHPANFALALVAVRAYPGAQALQALERWMDRFAGQLGENERPQAAAAFGQTLTEVLESLPASEEAVALAKRAAQAFPESARVNQTLGKMLGGMGRQQEALAAFSHALAVRQQAQTYRLEYPHDAPGLGFWQLAHHVRQHGKTP